MSVRIEDEKKSPGSMPKKAKEQRQARQQRRRKRKVRGRRKKGKSERLLTDLYQPPEEHTKAFKEAGLPSKGFWSLSHRNKARTISQLEVESNKGKLIMFDFGKGLICKY